MTYYFVGGEDSDFRGTGGVSVDTGSTFRRTAYSRCALCTSSSAPTDGWHASLGAHSLYWLAAQFYWQHPIGYNGIGNILSFYDGSVQRLFVAPDGSSPSDSSKWTLQKQTASGTVTVLATSAAYIPTDVLCRLDVKVDYQVSGTFALYVNGVLALSYSGDLTTNSATTLDGVRLNGMWVGGWGGHTYWSEVAVSSTDTRSIQGIMTLVPTGAGNSTSWTGAYTDVDETTLSADAVTSGTVNQVTEFTITPTGTLTGGNFSIGAVVVSAHAYCGPTGPQNMQAVVRTASTDYTSSTLALSAAVATVQGVWTTNPNTSAPWAASDITAGGFNIGLKSIT